MTMKMAKPQINVEFDKTMIFEIEFMTDTIEITMSLPPFWYLTEGLNRKSMFSANLLQMGFSRASLERGHRGWPLIISHIHFSRFFGVFDQYNL